MPPLSNLNISKLTTQLTEEEKIAMIEKIESDFNNGNSLDKESIRRFDIENLEIPRVEKITVFTAHTYENEWFTTFFNEHINLGENHTYEIKNIRFTCLVELDNSRIYVFSYRERASFSNYKNKHFGIDFFERTDFNEVRGKGAISMSGDTLSQQVMYSSNRSPKDVKEPLKISNRLVTINSLERLGIYEDNRNISISYTQSSISIKRELTFEEIIEIIPHIDDIYSRDYQNFHTDYLTHVNDEVFEEVKKSILRNINKQNFEYLDNMFFYFSLIDANSDDESLYIAYSGERKNEENRITEDLFCSLIEYFNQVINRLGYFEYDKMQIRTYKENGNSRNVPFFNMLLGTYHFNGNNYYIYNGDIREFTHEFREISNTMLEFYIENAFNHSEELAMLTTDLFFETISDEDSYIEMLLENKNCLKGHRTLYRENHNLGGIELSDVYFCSDWNDAEKPIYIIHIKTGLNDNTRTLANQISFSNQIITYHDSVFRNDSFRTYCNRVSDNIVNQNKIIQNEINLFDTLTHNRKVVFVMDFIAENIEVNRFSLNSKIAIMSVGEQIRSNNRLNNVEFIITNKLNKGD